MKNKYRIKRIICGAVIAICLFLLLGFTGTCENGGDLTKYVIRGTALLAITITAGVIGNFFG